MEYGAEIISLLYTLAFFVYLFWGVYIIQMNPKAGISKAFFAVSMSLCIWSCGCAMVSSALDLQAAVFWWRITAIGRMSLFSCAVHFMLFLANKNATVSQRKLFMLIHIPAIILIYIFSFSNAMTSIQYNLMKTDYGWISNPVDNVWDFLYYFYYTLYALAGLIIVWKWKKELGSETNRKQANLFFLTILGTLILGSFLDIILASFLKISLPSMTPFFALLPVWAMYYSARYYDALKVETVKEEVAVVSSKQKEKIFINLSVAICVSGILAFVAERFPVTLGDGGDIKMAIIKGGTLFILGLGLFSIQKIKKEPLKELITTIILLCSIPIVTFQFLEYSTITVWAFPILISISSFLFKKRTLLISTTIVAIITQRIVWILRPEAYVLVDMYDYILRIIGFCIVFLIGLYINKIYTSKIKENDYQIEFQKMSFDISFDFLGINQDNFDDNVNYLLKRIGIFFRADRTYLCKINLQDNTILCSNEWCNVETVPEGLDIGKIHLEAFPWCSDQLKRKKLLHIEDVSRMPEEARVEKDYLLRRSVKSVVAIPVIDGDEMQGFIGVDSLLSTKKWTEDDIKLLNIMGNLLSSAMVKIKSDQAIEFMAYNDHLTKLPNRVSFLERVNQAIHLSKQTDTSICVVFIDLDNFKLVNDTIGHKGGDKLLKEIAQGLGEILRSEDTVARFGGDEFMILLNNLTDYDSAINVADKIIKLFSNLFTINGQEFLVTASAGLAFYPLDGEDSETLVKNADMAMYKAKSMGKNQYALCTNEMKAEIKASMELSNDLHYALEKHELVVYYQPQIDLVTKQITGVEALLRWMHPTRGMILPGVFIRLAEENGLINSIGEWVFKMACIQNKKWQDMGLPKMQMAVNLSAIQFVNPRIADNIENILKETGLEPKYIELEITESIAIRETYYVLNVLNRLKEIGVSIAIDDFGTEYSSLSRLKMLPIDRIKIDMQFIQGIENNEKDQAITMVIISLAKSLGLNVLAEGVDTELQLNFLNQKMCDNVQGYFYYRPMPANEMEKILIDLGRTKEGDAMKHFNLLPIINEGK